MKNKITFLLVFLVFTFFGDAAVENTAAALEALVQRQLPLHAESFVFHLDTQVQIDVKTHSALDMFTLFDEGDGKVHIECTTKSACARGLYTYLTEIGKVDIYWTGSRLSLISRQLPPVGNNISRQAIVPWRYHFNTVTFSYTTVWWGWDEWEQMLDWMALHGINLPLAWLGYEQILQQVFLSIGLTQSEISSFFSGPAFLAWNRFGNIQGSWGNSTLPQPWMDREFLLSKQIIQRMVDLGMIPVLPAFTGFVPQAITRVAPNATVVRGSEWNGFGTKYSNDTFLEPFDPLFSQLQAKLVGIQKEVYGNVSNIYTLDQYNENVPFSGDPDYLRNISRDTMTSLRNADPSAVWLMQGWLFFDQQTFWTTDRIEAYLEGVEDPTEMIVLDLFSEAQPQWNRTESYYGKRWVWCLLHDYGGNMGLEGNLPDLTTQPLYALENTASMAGVGLSMEGQEGNEIVYALLLDQAWSNSSIDSAQYVVDWVERRYGPINTTPQILQAWDLLRLSVYNNNYATRVNSVVKSIFELQPSTTGLTNRTGHHGTALFYDPKQVTTAWELLLNATFENPGLLDIPTFHNDMVDVTRQVFQNAFINLYDELISSWNSSSRNVTQVQCNGRSIVEFLKDLDRVLGTDETFILGKWISDARRWSSENDLYANFLEYNARNQITMWGPTGQINDYASKQWSGLVETYYLPRWRIFVDYLASTTTATFNQTALVEKITTFELRWQLEKWGSNEGEKWIPTGNLLNILMHINAKWGDIL